MASAFWGGFASSLKGRLDQQHTQDLEMQKARAMKELEKEFGAEIVDPNQTRIEGNMEIRYNKYGTKISERPLSPQEIEARKLQMEEARLGVQSKGLDVEVKGKDAENYDSNLALDQDYKRQQIAASRDASARGWADIDLRKQQLSKADELQADKVVQALSRVHGVNGVNSGDAMIDRFNAALEAAPTDQDKKRVIAEWMGTAQRLLDERNNKWKGAGSSALPMFNPDGSVVTPRGP